MINFLVLFLKKFQNTFIKRFQNTYTKKFINKFLNRFHKFFIKIFSLSFKTKKSNYLYFERYIEKTIGIIELKDINLLDHLANKLNLIFIIFL